MESWVGLSVTKVNDCPLYFTAESSILDFEYFKYDLRNLILFQNKSGNSNDNNSNAGLYLLRAKLQSCTSCTVLIPLRAKIIWICKSPHRPLCFRTTTTTAFLISNIVVSNPYSHSAAFDSQFRTPYLKFKVRLIDLSQSDIHILYDLQIDNGIWQCVSSSWTGIFKNKFVFHGQYFRFATVSHFNLPKMVALLCG